MAAKLNTLMLLAISVIFFNKLAVIWRYLQVYGIITSTEVDLLFSNNI